MHIEQQKRGFFKSLFLSVTRLGLEPRTPTLKDLLSYRVNRFCDLRVQKYKTFFNPQENISKTLFFLNPARLCPDGQ